MLEWENKETGLIKFEPIRGRNAQPYPRFSYWSGFTIQLYSVNPTRDSVPVEFGGPENGTTALVKASTREVPADIMGPNRTKNTSVFIYILIHFFSWLLHFIDIRELSYKAHCTRQENALYKLYYYHSPEDDQSLLIETSVVPPVLFRTNYYSIEILHGVTANFLTYYYYYYHVINHKGNWLGTFFEKLLINKEKIRRARFETATSRLTCRRSTNWANY